MPLTVPLKTINLAPGSQISIPNLTWQDYETLLADLGEQRRVRISYYQGTIEIMSPLARHERPHRIIADIVKAMLDSQQRDWEDFGSTTFRRPQIAGLEPDTCLYIQNVAQVQGCLDMDLTAYPPPDLAIEADVTSFTTLDIYRVLQVPEVWIYRHQQLKIYLLQQADYLEVSTSSIFPDLPIQQWIPELVNEAIARGTSQMLRNLRKQLIRGAL
jgi:Uma2 family endonuclease